MQLIPDGPAGIAATLRAMKTIARQAKKSLVVRNVTLQAVKDVGNKDWRGEAAAIQQWVRSHIRYVKDATGVEQVADPETLLKIGQGDCDDQALLVAAMLESIGHPTRFVAVGKRPDYFSHVWTETRVGDRWLTVETTENVPIGWYPSGIVSRMVVHN